MVNSFLAFVLLAFAVSANADSSGQHPSVAQRCISKNAAGACAEYEKTFGVRGVTCTEDCLRQDAVFQCKLHNKCQYEAKSGCFTKSVCSEIDAVNNCKLWETQLVCK